MACWDKENNCWSPDLIEESFELDIPDKKIDFQTKRLAPIALLIPRCTDYPYKSWKLRCVED